MIPSVKNALQQSCLAFLRLDFRGRELLLRIQIWSKRSRFGRRRGSGIKYCSIPLFLSVAPIEAFLLYHVVRWGSAKWLEFVSWTSPERSQAPESATKSWQPSFKLHPSCWIEYAIPPVNNSPCWYSWRNILCQHMTKNIKTTRKNLKENSKNL